MNQRNIIAIVIAVVLLALIGAVAYMSQQPRQTQTENQTQTPPPASNGTDSGQDGSNQTQNQTEPAQDEAQSGEVTATISGNAFQPASLTIKKGTKVTWTNNDSVGHTVTADSPAANAPDSPQLDQGETYSFTFNGTGTFAYHCTPHPDMKATVTVVE